MQATTAEVPVPQQALLRPDEEWSSVFAAPHPVAGSATPKLKELPSAVIHAAEEYFDAELIAALRVLNDGQRGQLIYQIDFRYVSDVDAICRAVDALSSEQRGSLTAKKKKAVERESARGAFYSVGAQSMPKVSDSTKLVISTLDLLFKESPANLTGMVSFLSALSDDSIKKINLDEVLEVGNTKNWPRRVADAFAVKHQMVALEAEIQAATGRSSEADFGQQQQQRRRQGIVQRLLTLMAAETKTSLVGCFLRDLGDRVKSNGYYFEAFLAVNRDIALLTQFIQEANPRQLFSKKETIDRLLVSEADKDFLKKKWDQEGVMTTIYSFSRRRGDSITAATASAAPTGGEEKAPLLNASKPRPFWKNWKFWLSVGIAAAAVTVLAATVLVTGGIGAIALGALVATGGFAVAAATVTVVGAHVGAVAAAGSIVSGATASSALPAAASAVPSAGVSASLVPVASTGSIMSAMPTVGGSASLVTSAVTAAAAPVTSAVTTDQLLVAASAVVAVPVLATTAAATLAKEKTGDPMLQEEESFPRP